MMSRTPRTSTVTEIVEHEWPIPRRLDKRNVRQAINVYTQHIEGLELGPVAALRGRKLLHELKRGKVGLSPYPDVSWFEAANRIMTDLVILHGVRWLLARKVLPFDVYDVQYGNENRQSFDIQAESKGGRLVGEVFNVADSFVATKMRKTRQKLNELVSKPTYRLIMLNDDSASGFEGYVDDGIALVGVDVKTGRCYLRCGDLGDSMSTSQHD